jgi:hypothetical protein
MVPQTTGFTLTIPAGAIQLTGVTTQNAASISFTNALEAGKRYTISVKLVKMIYTKFASSNIYWDDSDADPTKHKLTFKPYSNRPDTVPENNYQGVFFKWGSLIGASPAGYLNSSFNQTDIVYVPSYNSGISSTWSATTGYVWRDILNPTGEDSKTHTDRNNNWVILPAQNDPVDDWTTALTGDICQYISKTQGMVDGIGNALYRLPTSNEFGSDETDNTWSGNKNGWSRVDGPNGNATSGSWNQNYEHPDATGKRTTIRSGAFYGPTANFFPASGGRNNTIGNMLNVGNSGYYWSGSVNCTSNEVDYNLGFSNVDINPFASNARYNGFPVRCVLQ